MIKRIRISRQFGIDLWGVVSWKGRNSLYINDFIDLILKKKSVKRWLSQGWTQQDINKINIEKKNILLLKRKKQFRNRCAFRLRRAGRLLDKKLLLLDTDRYGDLSKFLEKWVRSLSRLDLNKGTGIKKGWREKSDYGKMLLYRGCLLNFYGGLKKSELIRLSKILLLSNKNLSEEIYFRLESRLDMLVYWMNISTTVFESRDFIKKGYILVNKWVINKVSYIVSIGDIIEVAECFKKNIFLNIYRRNFYQGYPKYLEVNYKLLASVFIRKPVIDDIMVPFVFDWEFFSKHYYSKL